MKTNDYIKQLLETCSDYSMSDQDNKFLETEGLEKYIFYKLSSKKFRKWSLDSDSTERIKEAIHINIKANKPIHFTFPFGGYKLHQLPSSPEVDWAEFFTVAYYSKWVAPLSQVYKPGVVFSFSSDDVIIERMDNVPSKDTNDYVKSFRKMLTYFNNHSQDNMTFELKRVGDFYEKKEFEKELETHLKATKKDYENPDPVRYKKMIITSKLNIQWKGVEDWTLLPEKEKEEKIKMGPIFHDGYGKLSKRRAFVRGDDKVVVFATPISNAIALGTTKNSITKFWTGYGVLEKENESLYGRILSPDQLKNAKGSYGEEKVDLINLMNFRNIRVYDKRFNFTK